MGTKLGHRPGAPQARVIVKWTPQALAHLDQLAAYLVQESPISARGTLGTILASIDRLHAFPALGRPGRKPNTRELVVARTQFLVVYRNIGNDIELLAIVHGAQRWPPKSL